MSRLMLFFLLFLPLFGWSEEEWKGKLIFGNALADDEVYIVTDWLCPACQKLEPQLEKMLPKILEKARVVFVDLPNHPGSLNFVTYNVAFMLNNRADYLKTRPVLYKLSLSTKEPTKEQIQEGLTKLNIAYEPIPKETVEAIVKYFKGLSTTLKVKGTPTIVVKNIKTKEEKRFVGAEITEASLLQTLNAQ